MEKIQHCVAHNEAEVKCGFQSRTYWQMNRLIVDGSDIDDMQTSMDLLAM